MDQFKKVATISQMLSFAGSLHERSIICSFSKADTCMLSFGEKLILGHSL